MSQKGKKGKKAEKLAKRNALSNVSNMKDIAYLVRIVDEPNEPPIELSQKDFDLILDLGMSLPAREEVEEKGEGKDFATLETVNSKKFYHHGEPVKKKVAAAWFGRAMSKFIHDYANKVRETMAVEDIPEEARVHDPLVEEVTKALLQAWFPNGHRGEKDNAFAEDWENWQDSAAKDAAVAVAAVRAYATAHMNDQ